VIWGNGSAQITGSNNWVKTGTSDVPSTLTITAYYADPQFVNYGSDNLNLD